MFFSWPDWENIFSSIETEILALFYTGLKKEQEFLELFQLASSADNSMSMVAKMKELVPEFLSNNSVFEQLDGNNATVVSINKVG